MLPRTIDKARAKLAGTLGEYIYDCPLDRHLFAALSVDADRFLAAVRDNGDDERVLDQLLGGRVVPAQVVAELGDYIDAHSAHIDEDEGRLPA